MAMTHAICARIKLKPNSLEHARAWAQEIGARRAEAYPTLITEGVTVESVFLDSSAQGDFLVYYMRAESVEKAANAAAASVASIDEFHRQFKREVWVEVRKLELLVDLDRSCV